LRKQLEKSDRTWLFTDAEMLTAVAISQTMAM